MGFRVASPVDLGIQCYREYFRGKGSGLKLLGAMGGSGLVFDMQRFKEFVRAGPQVLGDVSWDFY